MEPEPDPRGSELSRSDGGEGAVAALPEAERAEARRLLTAMRLARRAQRRARIVRDLADRVLRITDAADRWYVIERCRNSAVVFTGGKPIAIRVVNCQDLDVAVESGPIGALEIHGSRAVRIYMLQSQNLKSVEVARSSDVRVVTNAPTHFVCTSSLDVAIERLQSMPPYFLPASAPKSIGGGASGASHAGTQGLSRSPPVTVYSRMFEEPYRIDCEPSTSPPPANENVFSITSQRPLNLPRSAPPSTTKGGRRGRDPAK